MFCQKCKKNSATVFYKEYINGNVKFMALCNDCSMEAQRNGEIKYENYNALGDAFGSPLNQLNNFFSELFNSAQGLASSQTKVSTGTNKKCQLCGASLVDISRDGKVGCAECYHVFSAEIDQTIKGIHGNVAHVGRVPKALKDKIDRSKKLALLKRELAVAIENQDFEHAVILRDEMRSMEF